MAAMRVAAAVIGLTLGFSALGCASEDAGVLSTSRLTATHDRVGPYRVVASTKGRPDDVVLHFSIDRGRTFLTLAMDDLAGDVWAANIPGAPAGTQVQYFVSADDARDPHDEAQVFAFDILPEQGPCTVDSDCVPGELCSERTCKVPAATCTNDDGCQQGFTCDTARSRCVIAERTCTLATERSACLLGEICDDERGKCAPRLECGVNASCPTGFVCQTARTLCLRR